MYFAPCGIDGYYSAKQTETGLILRQYRFGGAGHRGDLVTTLSWKNGQPVVLDQRFE